MAGGSGSPDGLVSLAVPLNAGFENAPWQSPSAALQIVLWQGPCGCGPENTLSRCVGASCCLHEMPDARWAQNPSHCSQPPSHLLSPSSVGRTLCFLVPALARFLVSQCVLIDFAADSSAHDAAKTQGRPMGNRQPAGDDFPFKTLMKINMRHRAGHWVRHGLGPAVHDVRQWEKDGAGKAEKSVEFVNGISDPTLLAEGGPWQRKSCRLAAHAHPRC